MITIGPWTFPKQPAHTSDLKAVRDMLEYGFKVSEIAKRLGRAEKTIYTWRRRYGWSGPREVAKKTARKEH